MRDVYGLGQILNDAFNLELQPHPRSNAFRRFATNEATLLPVKPYGNALIHDREQANPLLPPHFPRKRSPDVQGNCITA